MDITTVFFKMGVGTWVMDIITALPATPGPSFQIGKQLPTNVGFIYGLSTYADGVDSQNNPLISTTQAQNLYLQLQDGPTSFMEEIRMSDLLNEFAGSPVVRPDKFTPVNIPAFDLSKSSYMNPLLFTGATIRLKIWYVQKNDWLRIQKSFPFKAPGEYTPDMKEAKK